MGGSWGQGWAFGAGRPVLPPLVQLPIDPCFPVAAGQLPDTPGPPRAEGHPGLPRKRHGHLNNLGRESIFGGASLRGFWFQMGDNDFQEFLHCVQDPPQHFQAPAYSYT